MSDEPRDGTASGEPDPAHDSARETGTPTADEPAPAPVADDPRTEVSRTDDTRTGVSAPWERPARWKQSGLDPNRVDALLARLGDGTPETSTSHRSGSDGGRPAGALIAALSAPDDAAPSGGPAEHALPEGEAPEQVAPDAGTADHPAAAAPTSPPAVDHAPPSGVEPPVVAPKSGPAIDPTDEAPAPVDPDGEQPEPVGPDAAGDADEQPGDDPGDGAPVRDHGDGPGTDEIPAVTADAAALAEASSIRAALDRRSQAGRADGPEAPPPTGSSMLHGSPAPRRRRGLLYAGRTLAALLAFVTLLGVGVEWKIKDRAEVGIAQHAIPDVLDTSDPHISVARTVPTVVTNSKGVKTTEAPKAPTVYAPENILLLGSDTRAGGNAAIGGSDSSTDGVANSDTLMVAHVSGDREHVTVLSIPRDTVVTTPACRAWNVSTGKYTEATASVHGGTYSHINTLYAVGGPQCTVAGIQSLTGLGITRMIGIDFAGFKAMVDALGGITVNVCRPIVDRELGTVVPTAGTQLIRGAQAINLVRARNVIGDNLSDLARIHRQQLVLSAILRQVTEAGTLLNPAKLDKFLQAFTNNTFTANIKVGDLVTLAGSLGTLDPAHVTFYTLPTVPSTRIDGALDVDTGKAAVVFDDLINDLPLPGEVTSTAKARPTATTPAPTGANSLKLTAAPARIALEVYNVSGRSDVATTAQQRLQAIGFKVSGDQLYRLGDTVTGTTVEYAPANRAAALTVAAAVPGSTLVVTPGLGSTVRLLLGSSFNGTIKSVTVGQQAPASLATAVSTGSSVRTTPSTPSATLGSTDLSSVNAGTATCV